MNVINNFLNNNLDKLIQIYIKERKDNGFGTLIINVNKDTNKIDCRFFPINMINFSEELYTKLKDFQESNPNSIMYLTVINYINDKEVYDLIQIDLDKRNNLPSSV